MALIAELLSPQPHHAALQLQRSALIAELLLDAPGAGAPEGMRPEVVPHCVADLDAVAGAAVSGLLAALATAGGGAVLEALLREGQDVDHLQVPRPRAVPIRLRPAAEKSASAAAAAVVGEGSGEKAEAAAEQVCAAEGRTERDPAAPLGQPSWGDGSNGGEDEGACTSAASERDADLGSADAFDDEHMAEVTFDEEAGEVADAVVNALLDEVAPAGDGYDGGSDGGFSCGRSAPGGREGSRWQAQGVRVAGTSWQARDGGDGGHDNGPAGSPAGNAHLPRGQPDGGCGSGLTGHQDNGAIGGGSVWPPGNVGDTGAERADRCSASDGGGGGACAPPSACGPGRPGGGSRPVASSEVERTAAAFTAANTNDEGALFGCAGGPPQAGAEPYGEVRSGASAACLADDLSGAGAEPGREPGKGSTPGGARSLGLPMAKPAACNDDGGNVRPRQRLVPVPPASPPPMMAVHNGRTRLGSGRGVRQGSAAHAVYKAPGGADSVDERGAARLAAVTVEDPDSEPLAAAAVDEPTAARLDTIMADKPSEEPRTAVLELDTGDAVLEAGALSWPGAGEHGDGADGRGLKGAAEGQSHVALNCTDACDVSTAYVGEGGRPPAPYPEISLGGELENVDESGDWNSKPLRELNGEPSLA
mmetsp:Transcript_27797/g.82394  ORF Transcript_27797/g.82394 Transcript_27797/m.82394 type:complete len:648 (-) Transcript_27797:1270-3213(-)